MKQWYKFNTKWSSGFGEDEYIFLESTDATDYFQELSRDEFDSEHFRGIEYNPVDKPPNKWLQSERSSINSRIIYLKEYLNQLDKELNN